MIFPTLNIGSYTIGEHFPCFIIAEIGVNHEGDVGRCISLVKAAKSANANAVKLQTIDVEKNYVEGTESYKIFKHSCLSPNETREIFEYARSIGIEIFTTVGDTDTMDWVMDLKPCAHKISSGLLNHQPLIRYAAKTGLPILLSTGMSELLEIDSSVNIVKQESCKNIGIFQCTSLYPAAPEKLNLSAIRFLGSRYNIVSGFSDHSIGIDYAIMSVAAGANMLEKHFTDDVTRTGYDHGISLEEPSFQDMVSRIRNLEKAMGVYGEKTTVDVTENALKYKRCVVAVTDIEKGELLTCLNLGIKRPANSVRGESPCEFDNLIGTKAKTRIVKDASIRWRDVT